MLEPISLLLNVDGTTKHFPLTGLLQVQGPPSPIADVQRHSVPRKRSSKAERELIQESLEKHSHFDLPLSSANRRGLVVIQKLVRVQEHVDEVIERPLRRIRGLDAGGLIELFQMLSVLQRINFFVRCEDFSGAEAKLKKG